MENSDESVENPDHPMIMAAETSAPLEEDTFDCDTCMDDWYLFLFPIGLLFHWIFPMEARNTVVLGIASICHLPVDALFLYVPLINEDIKCVTVDNRLKIAALVLRSFSDLRYLVRIFQFIKIGRRESLSFEKIAKSIALDILSLLPIPQVVVLVFLPNMTGSNSLKVLKFLNSLVVLQCFVRAYPMYILYKDWNMKSSTMKDSNGLYGRGIFISLNFLAFLLASHVLGAFWYFFSIQREIDCWGHASKFEYGSKFSTSCHGGTLANVTLINNHCPINPADASVFDFGIFLYVLQSGMQTSTNFPQKFFQCFSWGLRNLSSFASNLNSSTYGWENLFVVVISTSGLILFMYLLGHVQTYMQRSSINISEKLRDTIEPKIQDMISEYGLPKEMKSEVKRVVRAELENNEDLVVENMFSILSSNLIKDLDDRAKSSVRRIKYHIFIDKLKKVIKLENKSQEVLTEICEKLEPMIYNKGCYIVKRKEPLDMMFFVTRGIVLTYATNTGGSNGTIQMKKDKDFLHGEELITWAQEDSSCELSNLPISAVTVKCYNEVEVFTLSATELHRIVSKYRNEFNMDRTLTIAVENETANQMIVTHLFG